MLFSRAIVVLSLVIPSLCLAGNRAPVTDASGSSAMEQRLARLERLVSSQGLLDLLQQVEALQTEIGRLRGQVEVQNHELSQLKEQQRNLFTDVDRRMQQLEANTSARSPDTPASSQTLEAIETDPGLEIEASDSIAGETPAATETATGDQTATETVAETTTEEATTTGPAETVAEDTTETVEAPVDPLRAQAEYQKAFQLLKQANYTQAIKAFSEYLQKYPTSEYSDNAQYWLGETFYVTRKFDNAINAYQTLIDSYPESRKIAHGMLKLGYSYQELGNLPEAKKRLEELKNQFPGSTAARLADERLRTIKIPGSS